MVIYLENRCQNLVGLFFDLILKPNLHLSIEEEFADMIKKSKGNKPTEKFIDFLSNYFENNNCNVKLKFIEVT